MIILRGWAATQQLMQAELAVQSTVAQATAHGLECCAACSVLGCTWVQATNTYQLGRLHWSCPWLASLCPNVIIHQHQKLLPGSCWDPWCSRLPSAAGW